LKLLSLGYETEKEKMVLQATDDYIITADGVFFCPAFSLSLVLSLSILLLGGKAACRCFSY
jgi:hypothetical protein